MRVVIVAVGRQPPAWVREGLADYRRRLPAALAPELRLVTPERHGGPAERARREAARLRRRLPSGAHTVALEVAGRAIDSRGVARSVQRWREAGRDVAFLVGGADGLDAELAAGSGERWSLSALTFPHGLVPLLLTEQLWRAWSILEGHPYHR